MRELWVSNLRIRVDGHTNSYKRISRAAPNCRVTATEPKGVLLLDLRAAQLEAMILDNLV